MSLRNAREFPRKSHRGSLHHVQRSDEEQKMVLIRAISAELPYELDDASLQGQKSSKAMVALGGGVPRGDAGPRYSLMDSG